MRDAIRPQTGFVLFLFLGLLGLTGKAAEPVLTKPKLTIETVAGTGVAGYAGDGGPALQAQLNNPYGLVIGPEDNLYFCDMGNHVIRRVDQRGIITTVVGTGKKGYSGDGGPALQAELNEPYEIRFDPAGHMFFVEMRNHLLRRVDAATGIITTVAGNGGAGFAGDGGPATQAKLNQPHSIQLRESRGTTELFICDIGNHRIRQVNLQTGLITTFAGTGQKAATPDGGIYWDVPLNGPRALDFDEQGDLWLALREGNAVYEFDLKKETIHHRAGTGRQGFSGHDGPAKEATLSGPKGLSVGPDGNIYLADTESHSIRMIERATGKIHLIAGTGRRGDGPDGDPWRCQMARPHGVFAAANGTIFVGDSEAHKVRAIRPKH